MLIRPKAILSYLCVLLMVASCSFVPTSADKEADIIVVGDSILAWHRGAGQSIPDIIEEASGLTVSNVAISGATFLGAGGIPSQYETSDWDWVIMNGGGNDLRSSCGTAEADRILNHLISPDGEQGAIPTFARSVSRDGSQVLVLGYYPVSEQGGPFEPCIAVLDELAKRQQLMAEQQASVVFVDSGRVIGAGDASAYAADLVHPSPRGAALIGQLVSSTLRASTQ